MWIVKQQWNLSLKLEDVTDACAKCLVCSHDTSHPRHMKQEQIDYIRPLPKAQESSYVLTVVDTATRLLFAWPCAATDQKYPIQALKHLRTFYGRPLVAESDQGTHFTRHKVQTWAKQMNIQ